MGRIITVALLLLIATVATVAAWRCRTESIAWQGKYEQLQSNLDALTRQAGQEVAKARDARMTVEREVKSAVDAAEARVKSAADLIREKELYKIHPDLQLISGSTFTVGKGPVASFSVADSGPGKDGYPSKRVTITYQNNGPASIKPTVRIYFHNEYGLVTGYALDQWTFSSIGPGERRIEETFATFEHGPPVYWRIDVSQ